MICIILSATISSQVDNDILKRVRAGDEICADLEGTPAALVPIGGGDCMLDRWWNTIQKVTSFSHVFLVVNADKYQYFEQWVISVAFPLANVIITGRSLLPYGDCLSDVRQVLRSPQLRHNRRTFDLADNQDVVVVAGDIRVPDTEWSGLSDALAAFRGGCQSANVALCCQLDDSVAKSADWRAHGDTVSASPATLQVCPDTKRIVDIFGAGYCGDAERDTSDKDGAVALVYCLRAATLCLIEPFLQRSHNERVHARASDHRILSLSSFVSWLIAEHGTIFNTVFAADAGHATRSPHRLEHFFDRGRLSPLRHIQHCPRHIRHKVFARVGLMGNPSDGFFGKTISLSIANFWAEVTITESERVCLVGHRVHDATCFSSLRHLHESSALLGYDGGLRLIQATCKRFYQLCAELGVQLAGGGQFTLRYNTNIPRQVGLAGSSALVVGCLRCLLDFYRLPVAEQLPSAEQLLSAEQLPVLTKQRLAQVALDVERDELGITAGLQDRVVQVFEGLVFMNFDGAIMQRCGHGLYERLAVSHCLPPLFIVYLPRPSHSGRIHSSVRQRWLEGDEQVLSAMSRFAQLTECAREALLDGDWSTLGRLMNENFQLRKSIFGVECLGVDNLRMIELGRQHGACCKFPGSGGAVLGLARDLHHRDELRDVYEGEGYVFVSLVTLLKAGAADNSSDFEAVS